MSRPKVILAYSGGLDTSYCVAHLTESGYDVVTVFVDTAGMTGEEAQSLRDRAIKLGAIEHVHVDGGDELWNALVVPLVQGGAWYQNQYPLLCADRYLVAQKAVEVARQHGCSSIAHGCTAMGNDQVRFDLAINGLGQFDIVAPVRDLQQQTDEVREYEKAFLTKRGVDVDPKTQRYTINQNLLGATLSGAEIDAWQAPGPGSYCLTQPASEWPTEPHVVKLGFERGVAVTLNDEGIRGAQLLSLLNASLGAYGVGRGTYCGDTVVGLKGRIVYEAPGLVGLRAAHQALEEAVFTREQNRFKPQIAAKWTELTYQGQYFDPLRSNLEAFLTATQERVSGAVTLRVEGGRVLVDAIESEHILAADGAVYAQTADWSAEAARGFIKLFGQSTTLWASKEPGESS